MPSFAHVEGRRYLPDSHDLASACPIARVLRTESRVEPRLKARSATPRALSTGDWDRGRLAMFWIANSSRVQYRAAIVSAPGTGNQIAIAQNTAALFSGFRFGCNVPYRARNGEVGANLQRTLGAGLFSVLTRKVSGVHSTRDRALGANLGDSFLSLRRESGRSQERVFF